jgi:sporulation protein YlmC with PRC-barrel domain
MPHYGILREYRFEEELNDIRGSEVYGVNDEKLGTIDDVVFNHSTGDIRYIVLKTGGLFTRKKIIVPASRIEPYGNHEDKFYAELDKERLEMLPEFEEGKLKSENDWSNFEKDFEKRWNDGAVLYNKDTGRVVTPPMEQVEGTRRMPLSEEGRRSLDRDLTPERMGKQDSLLGVSGSVNDKTTLQPTKASIAGREDAVSSEIRREVTSPVSSAAKVPLEETRDQVTDNLRDPGIYKVDATEATTMSETPTREIEDTMGGEMEIPVERQGGRLKETMREPHIYRLEDDRTDTNLGNRWSGFQDRLRSRRDKIITGCPTCGSQEKVA